MPNCFYEVEHSTNIINSLNKFYELQDFRSKFCIVADIRRKTEFCSLIYDLNMIVDGMDSELIEKLLDQIVNE